ncbi:MAG: DivIVA domain-containing protein, partial [Thermoleophilia bacterium]|nr:DivIVA domain-containing protein [Thermoleophilia bacterium]
MKLTPLDIRHKEFKRGMRGYVDEEVDEFLDQIADEFERLFKDNIDLGERVENLEEQVTRYRRIEETLQKTLVSAQQSAEELKQNATKEGQLILRDAELKARQMVNESYADKQRIEGSLTKLRGVEEEFRIRFRQLLEGFLKQVEQAPPVAPPPQNDLNQKAEAIKEAIAREETVVAPPARAGAPAPAGPPAQAAAPAHASPAPPERAPEPRPAGPAQPPQPRPDPATRKVPRFGPGSGDLEAMTSVVPRAEPGASQPGAG